MPGERSFPTFCPAFCRVGGYFGHRYARFTEKGACKSVDKPKSSGIPLAQTATGSSLAASTHSMIRCAVVANRKTVLRA